MSVGSAFPGGLSTGQGGALARMASHTHSSPTPLSLQSLDNIQLPGPPCVRLGHAFSKIGTSCRKNVTSVESDSTYAWKLFLGHVGLFVSQPGKHVLTVGLVQLLTRELLTDGPGCPEIPGVHGPLFATSGKEMKIN